jgi:hypothetical protein
MRRQLAEGVGFEPTRGSAPTRSPGVRLRPLGHPSERARPYKGPILEATITAPPLYGATRISDKALPHCRRSQSGAPDPGAAGARTREHRPNGSKTFKPRPGVHSLRSPRSGRPDSLPTGAIGSPALRAGDENRGMMPAAGDANGRHGPPQLARTWIRFVCAGPAFGRNSRSTPFLQLASMRSASSSSDSVNDRS